MNKHIQVILAIVLVSQCLAIKPLRLLEVDFESPKDLQKQAGNLRQQAPSSTSATSTESQSSATSTESSSGSATQTSATSTESSSSEEVEVEEIIVVPEVPKITMPTEIADYIEDEQTISETFFPNKSGYSVEKIPVVILGNAESQVVSLEQINYKYTRVCSIETCQLMTCKLMGKGFRRVECENKKRSTVSVGGVSDPQNRNSRLNNLNSVVYEIFNYPLNPETSFLSVWHKLDNPVIIELNENITASTITYTYHNILIFAVFKDKPTVLKYRAFKRPEFLKDNKQKFAGVEKEIENELLEGPNTWIDIPNITVPKDHKISRLESFGSDRNAGVRVYTEYSGSKALSDLTPEEGNLHYIDLTYAPHSFSGWESSGFKVQQNTVGFKADDFLLVPGTDNIYKSKFIKVNNLETLETGAFKVLKDLETSNQLKTNQRLFVVEEDGKKILRFIEFPKDKEIHRVIADVNLNINTDPRLLTTSSVGDENTLVVFANINKDMSQKIELEAIVINLLQNK